MNNNIGEETNMHTKDLTDTARAMRLTEAAVSELWAAYDAAIPLDTEVYRRPGTRGRTSNRSISRAQ